MLKRRIVRSLAAIAFGCIAGIYNATAQTTPLPYYTDFDNGSAANWTFFAKGAANNGDLPWVVTIHNPYTESWSLMHTCSVGGGNTVDNWIVSPLFSFASGGKIDSVRSYLATGGGPGLPGPGDTIGIYLLNGSADPALASSVTLLANFWTGNTTLYSWVKTANVNIPPTAGNSYIAFRYRAVNNCINAYVDNLSISGNPTAIQPIYKEGEDFTIAPNPAVNKINITTKKVFEEVSLYNAAGQRVYTTAYSDALEVSSLPAGIYTLELRDKDNKKGIARIVKK